MTSHLLPEAATWAYRSVTDVCLCLWCLFLWCLFLCGLFFLLRGTKQHDRSDEGPDPLFANQSPNP